MRQAIDKVQLGSILWVAYTQAGNIEQMIQRHSQVHLEPLKGCCCCSVTSIVSDSVRPHRWEPTRLPFPWDSPGKNTGVGCHFLLQLMKVKSESEVAQLCPTLCDPMDCSLPGFSIHGIFQARVLEWGAIAFCNFQGAGELKRTKTKDRI